MASSPVYPNHCVCYCILHGLVSGRKKSYPRSWSHLSLAVARLSFLVSVLKTIVQRVRRAAPMTDNAQAAIALFAMRCILAPKISYRFDNFEMLRNVIHYSFLYRIFFGGGSPSHSIMSDGWTQCGMTTDNLTSMVGLRVSCCPVCFSSGLRCTISKFPAVSRTP